MEKLYNLKLIFSFFIVLITSCSAMEQGVIRIEKSNVFVNDLKINFGKSQAENSLVISRSGFQATDGGFYSEKLGLRLSERNGCLFKLDIFFKEQETIVGYGKDLKIEKVTLSPFKGEVFIGSNIFPKFKAIKYYETLFSESTLIKFPPIGYELGGFSDDYRVYLTESGEKEGFRNRGLIVEYNNKLLPQNCY